MAETDRSGEPVRAREAVTRTREDVTRAALDPTRSVVVEACAGSGKTWLLVARMLRLLLAGAAPSSLLAITFTRKGAEEMNARLMQLLETLAGAGEEEARALLRQRALSETEIDAALPKARTLFAEVAFASPGITISTFHGWFQQLLAAAPLGFGLGDSGIADSEARLMDEAWLSFAEALNRQAEAPTALALQRLFAARGLSNTRKLLADFVSCRVEWQLYARDHLGVAADAKAEEVLAAAEARWAEEWQVDEQGDPLRAWRISAQAAADCCALIEGLRQEEKLPRTARERIDALEAAWSIEDAEQCYAAAYGALMTAAGTPVVLVENWAGKAGLADVHERFCDGLTRLAEQRRARANLDMNRDALRAGLGLLDAYEKCKRDQRSLDYTDLEWRAFELLADSVHAETLQYRLDCRYRHVLLDEFQDTSPLQWRCLTAWLDASAAAGDPPSVFMVGDPKQAIYRFRRTDARLFAIARDYFREHYGATDCRLDSTRRNAPAVVAFVNALFTDLPDYDGFHSHLSEQLGMNGEALVLPRFARAEAAPREAAVAWRDPLQMPLQDDAQQRYAAEAEALADGIRRAAGRLMIEQRDPAGGWRRRPARYGDFLVLFRRRAPLPAFEDALRAAGIPYLSARSGGLIETLEVRDLVALLTFLSTPDADLALAQVLKSPIFGASDQDLLALRFANPPAAAEGAWWPRLQALAFAEGDDSALARAQRQLRTWQRWMDTLPVHDLLDRIFFDADVLARYATSVPPAMRAGVVANLHAFMALALQVDGGRYPSLARFLDELKSYRALPDEDAPDLGEVRDAGEAGDGERPDAVRMMTIHMAKGLEAPVVWLIDAADNSTRPEHHHALVDWRPDEPAPRHFSFVADQASRDAARLPIFEEEARYRARERRNLLYVAATRARQVFIVSGTEPAKASGQSWLEWAEERAGTSAALWPDYPAAGAAPVATPAADYRLPPVWTSGIGTRRAPDLDKAARRQGIELHAALERLAPVGSEGRFRAAAYLDKPVDTPAMREARRLLQLPGLRKFFHAGEFLAAGNEVEIASPEGVVRIDRLVEFSDEVWVLDYKSGEADNDANRAQVEGYCRLVAALYPTLRVRGALIGGEGPLIEVG